MDTGGGAHLLLGLAIAATVVILGPPVVIWAHQKWEKRHHRRMNTRRTDKIKL